MDRANSIKNVSDIYYDSLNRINPIDETRVDHLNL